MLCNHVADISCPAFADSGIKVGVDVILQELPFSNVLENERLRSAGAVCRAPTR